MNAIVMPTKDTSQLWSALWKVNQVLVPLLVAWGIFITTEAFANRAHRERPHAVVPVEMDALHKVDMRLETLSVKQDFMQATLEELKKGLLNK